MSGPVPEDEWATVVEHVPLVSVDLVVQHDGGIILGERTNEPANGEWFVPGGTVRKDERLDAAVDRIAREELGISVTVERRLGVYEHRYDVAAAQGVESKHYVPIGHLVTAEGDPTVEDDQHADLQVFHPPFADLDLHPYVRQYLVDAGFEVAGPTR